MIVSDLVDKIMEKMSTDSKNRRQVLVFCFVLFFVVSFFLYSIEYVK